MNRIKRIASLLLLGFILFISLPISAQNLDGSHLKPYSNKWKMYAVDKDGNETLVRIWTDFVQNIKLDGKAYISRVQELYDTEMHLQDLWTNLFERESMRPYRASQFRTSGDFQYLEFLGMQVETKVQSGDSAPKDQEFKFDKLVHDWTLYGILLSAIEFKKGASTTLPVFMPQAPNQAGQLVATVEGKESVTDENGKVHNTWKVSTNFGLTFWLSKKAPYVIQLVLPGQNGSHNIWRMF